MVAVLREDKRRFKMIELIMPRVWMYRRRWTPTLGVRRRQCTTQERLANMRRWKCQLSILTLVRRTHALIIGNSQSNEEVHKETGGLVFLAHPRLMVRECALISDPSEE